MLEIVNFIGFNKTIGEQNNWFFGWVDEMNICAYNC